jgi:alpha-galactosidase
MSADTKAILTNKEVIAINQDPLGVQGFKHSMKDSVHTWLKPLKGGGWAVCFLNRSVLPKSFQYDWTPVIDTVSKRELNPKNTVYTLRDLWLKKEAGTTEKPVKATLAPHDVLVLRLTPKK